MECLENILLTISYAVLIPFSDPKETYEGRRCKVQQVVTVHHVAMSHRQREITRVRWSRVHIYKNRLLKKLLVL